MPAIELPKCVAPAINFKGGTGKTTVAIAIAEGLCHLFQKRVLIIDCDFQCSASIALLGRRTLNDLIARDATLDCHLLKQIDRESTDHFSQAAVPARYCVKDASDLMFVLPASPDMPRRERQILAAFLAGSDIHAAYAKASARIAELYRSLLPHFDFILIDCPPGLTLFSEAAIKAADGLIIPTLPSEISLAAIDHLRREITRSRPDRELEDLLIGTVISKLRPRSGGEHYRQQIKSIENLLDRAAPGFRILKPYLPYCRELEMTHLARRRGAPADLRGALRPALQPGRAAGRRIHDQVRRAHGAPVPEQPAAAASDGDMTEPLNTKPRIVAIGVGGAGGNAVNNMIASGLSGVKFVVANTDVQALAASRTEHRIQLGHHLTEGLGAGSKPEIGEAAAEEAIDEIAAHIADAHMLFIAAGMGGGTGTGAAYVVARKAREFGILTVAVVTKPFQFEGMQRMRNADAGIAALLPFVDTLLVIPNENLFRVVTDKTTFAEAFVVADQVLYSGIACLVDLIVKEGLINLDLADVSTILRGMGSAMIGMGEASDEQRAIVAAEEAIVNPLLDNITLKGAKSLLLSIAGGRDLTLWEVDEAASRVRQEVDPDANIIVGAILDESLEDRIRVAIVASGMPGCHPCRGAGRARQSSVDAALAARLGRRRRAVRLWPAAVGRDRRGRPQGPQAAWPRPQRGRRGTNARDGPEGSTAEVAVTPRPKRGKRATASDWGPPMAAAAQSGGRPARRQPLAIEGPAVLEPAPPEFGWPEQWAGASEQTASAPHRPIESLEATVAHAREPQPAPRKATLFGRLFGRGGARRDV